MPMNVETTVQYYGIYFSRYDAQSPAQDVLGELRQFYFENGHRQKNKITRETGGAFCRYAYVLEAGSPLKWKKMTDGRLTEKAVSTGEGGYLVYTQDPDKRVVKKTFFDLKHHWFKTEYYSQEFKKTPTAVLSLGADESILVMHEYSGAGEEEASFQLYPSEIPRDPGELSLLNGAAGVPEVAARTNRGNFYYCRREETQRRRTVLEAIRSGNQAPPLFSAERPEYPEEEADRVGGFQVTLHSDDPAVPLTQEEEPLEVSRKAREIEDNLEELKRIQQEVQATLRHYDESDSYQWPGTVDAAKYLVEEDAVAPVEMPEHEKEAPVPFEEAALAFAPDNEPEEEAEKPPTEKNLISPEEDMQTDAAAYTYSGIEVGGETVDPAQALENMGLSADERQRLGRYNVIIQPISKNKYARPEADAAQESAQEGAKPAPVDYEQVVLGRAETDIPYTFRNECSGVFDGCPYAGQEKTKISTSPTESYYYFGGVSQGKREGRGRTVMENGYTAYEGGYADDKRDGFGVYYYKTGRLCYAGEWKENRRQGMGVAFRPGERTIQVGRWQENAPVGTTACFDYEGNLLYSGRWKAGKRQGTGVGYTEDGGILVGCWQEGSLSGKGTQFDADGNLVYTGQWQDGERSGRGVLYHVDGTVRYSGEWMHDLYDGKGVLYREDGHTVTGDFRYGKVCGQAEERDENGQKVYDGSWDDSLYHGGGCKYLPDGGRCEGTFLNGEPSGFLDGYTAEGELVYSGEWKDWQYHGEGCSYSGGEKLYEGSFREGRCHGRGYEYQDGSYVYSGEFEDNMRCGFGTSYAQGRPVYTGGWQGNRYEGAGLLYEDGRPRYAGNFCGGRLDGRVNAVIDGAVRVEGVYEEGSLVYVRQYSAEGCLEYEGNVRAGKPAGMGCTYSPYGEKKEEGIFTGGALTRSMKVTRRRMPTLAPSDKLMNTEYEAHRQAPAFAVEQQEGEGLYSGQLGEKGPHGKGTILWADHRYTGFFEEGSPRGEGMIYRTDGSTLRGTFVTPRHTGARCLAFAGGVTYFYLPANEEPDYK